MPKFTWVIVEDWQGLYKDGEIVLEGHDLHPVWFAKELGIDLYNYDEGANEFAMDTGRLPDKLTDIPFTGGPRDA